MARRYRHGLARYKTPPVARKKGSKGPAKPARRLVRWPKPGTPQARRHYARVLGELDATELAMRNNALAENLGRAGYEGSAELWAEYQDHEYRRAYNARQREARAAKPKAPSAWVKVKAHKRHRPGAHR